MRNVLLTISEWMGRKSGREEDSEDFFEEDNEDDDTVDISF